MYTTGPIAWDPVTSQWIWFSVIQVGGGGSSLPGTYSPNNYTTAVVASGGSPVGAVTDGNIVEFSSQSGVSYLLTNVVSLGLAIWPPYNGTSGSGVTATGPSYFSHFHGSEDGGKTVTNDQSLGSGAQVYFSLCFANIVSPGCGYAIENTASSNRYWINPVTFSYGVQSGTQVTGGNAIYYPHNSTFVEFSWVQSGATFTGQGYTANTNPSSPALADVTTSLPSQWRSGTATITQIFCASGTQYNDCLFGMSCSSGDSRLMEVTVGVFSGLTFTDQTPSFLSGRQIVGMAYDSVHNLYGVLLDNGKLYTSLAPSKSTSWTLTYTFTPTATRLATVGGVWAVGLAEGASGNVARVYISSDITGSPTWHATGGCFSTDITSSGKLSYLVSSGNSLAAISDTSLQMAFSNMVGYA
jgi:hypothetical protein